MPGVHSTTRGRSVPRKTSEARLAKLAAQAAAILNRPVEEITQAVKQSYTQRDRVIEANTVYLYYEYRKEQLTKGPKETDSDFISRQREWSYKICAHCHMEFAYSYRYDDVAFCSLDCIARELAKSNITFDYSRPLELRWGFQNHPAIVPALALASVEEQLSESYGSDYVSPEHPSQPRLPEAI